MTRDSDLPSPRSLSSQSSSASHSSSSYSVSSSYAELEEAILTLFISYAARRIADDYLSYSSSSSDISSEDGFVTLVRALKEFCERRYGNRDTESANSGENQDDGEAAIASNSLFTVSLPSTPSTPSLPSTPSTPSTPSLPSTPSTPSTPSLFSATPSPAPVSPLAPQSLPPAPPSPTQRLLLNMGKQRAQRRLYAPGRTAALRDLEDCRPLGDYSKDLVCQKDRRDETTVQGSRKRKYTKENGPEDHRVSSTEAVGAVGSSSPSGGGASRRRKQRRIGSS
ncbi:MAG: hypothetical protein Q9221_006970 [Calogaya cf. arnoldii]